MGKMVDETGALRMDECVGAEKGEPFFTASCDQEAWVQDRIEDAIRMALALRDNRGVAANEDAHRLGLKGIVQGTAIEIIRTLGGEPEFANLPNPNPPRAGIVPKRDVR